MFTVLPSVSRSFAQQLIVFPLEHELVKRTHPLNILVPAVYCGQDQGRDSTRNLRMTSNFFLTYFEKVHFFHLGTISEDLNIMGAIAIFLIQMR